MWVISSDISIIAYKIDQAYTKNLDGIYLLLTIGFGLEQVVKIGLGKTLILSETKYWLLTEFDKISIF